MAECSRVTSDQDCGLQSAIRAKLRFWGVLLVEARRTQKLGRAVREVREGERRFPASIQGEAGQSSVGPGAGKPELMYGGHWVMLGGRQSPGRSGRAT